MSRASLVFIQSLFPRMVLISPLWPIILNGWARLQVGKVLVEKRECTRAIALVKYGSVRSGKYSLSWRELSIPLYTIVLVERLAK